VTKRLYCLSFLLFSTDDGEEARVRGREGVAYKKEEGLLFVFLYDVVGGDEIKEARIAGWEGGIFE